MLLKFYIFIKYVKKYSKTDRRKTVTTKGKQTERETENA